PLAGGIDDCEAALTREVAPQPRVHALADAAPVGRDHERDPLPVVAAWQQQVGGPGRAVVRDVVNEQSGRVRKHGRRQTAGARRRRQEQDDGEDCKDDAMRLVDVHFGGSPEQIGVYVVETDDGLALFDCGPSSTLPALESGLAAQGLVLTDIRHLLLSHVHLDHAGAAGAIVRRHPELTVWVSEIGAPHLVDPSRLERSARRLYGDAFESLWGGLVPGPGSNVRIAAGYSVGRRGAATGGSSTRHRRFLMKP